MLGRSVHTVRNYRSDIGVFLGFLAERGIEFDRAGRMDGRAFLGEQREAGVAEASIKRRASTVRGFYGWLDREGQLPPARPGDSILTLRYPKAPRRLPRFLSEDQAAALGGGAGHLDAARAARPRAAGAAVRGGAARQ